MFRTLIIVTLGLCLLLSSGDAFAKGEDLERARTAAKSGDWESVYEYAQAAVNENSKDEDALALLARATVFLGDTAAALNYYERALERNPRHKAAILEVTSLLVEQNKLDEANRLVEAAEKKDTRGKIDEIKVARALILGAQGKIGEATPILASVTAKNPNEPVYPRMLAQIYRNANVLELAATNYQKAWDLNKGDPELAFEYGQVLLKLKRYDEANNLFKIVQEQDPDNKIVDYLRGRLLYAAGRFGEAASELEKAVEKRPDDFLSNYWLGKSYLDFSISSGKNAYGLAVAPMSKALELRPEREDIAADLAKAIFEQGKYYYRLGSKEDTTEAYVNEQLQQAIDYFHESVNTADIDGDLYSYMARAHDKLGALDSALYYTDYQLKRELLRLVDWPAPEIPEPVEGEEPIDEPLAPKPPAVDSPVAIAFQDSIPLIIKSARLNQNDVRRMVSLLQRLKDQQGLVNFLAPLMNDEDFFASYGMIVANAYIETRDYAAAREMMNRLIEADPTNCDLHQLNAYIDLKRENYKGAVAVLKQAVEACPRNADLWVYLGDSYYFSNENDRATVQKAKEAYDKACSLGDPTGCEKADQTKQILAQLR